MGGAQELRTIPSYSKLLQATPSYSEWLLRATRALRARIDFAGLPSYSIVLGSVFEFLRFRGFASAWAYFLALVRGTSGITRKALRKKGFWLGMFFFFRIQG